MLFVWLILLVGWVLFQIFKPDETEEEGQWMYAAPRGAHKKMLERLGLDKPSEDASHILDKTKVSSQAFTIAFDRERMPNLKRDWVIQLLLPAGGNFKETALQKIFDDEWRQEYFATVFGYSLQKNKWVYLPSQIGNDEYREVQISVNLISENWGVSSDINSQAHDSFLESLKGKLEQYPDLIEYKVTESKPEIIEKANHLKQLFNTCEQDATIILKSTTRFKGKQAWDALLSLGLEWGHMDYFHWRNEDNEYNDSHFSVYTDTSPGYFLPENIAGGSMNPQDLIFSFSIPRTADPLNVFTIMLNAAKYCQKRLGGQLLNAEREVFIERFDMNNIRQIVRQMEDKSIPPGSKAALEIF